MTGSYDFSMDSNTGRSIWLQKPIEEVTNLITRKLFIVFLTGTITIFLLLMDLSGSRAESVQGLIVPSKRGDIVGVWKALSHGAAVDQENRDGATALMISSERGFIGIARLLLKHGATVNKKDRSGTTPLMLAAEKGHSNIVRILLSHGANIDATDKDGNTALMLAAWSNKEMTARILLSHGAQMDLKNKNGATALMIAVAVRDYYTVRDLLSYKRNRFLGNNGNFAPSLSSDKVNKSIPGQFFDPNGSMDHGITPLMVAVWNGSRPLVRLLLDYGANPNRSSDNKTTALTEAASKGNLAIVRTLLERGADPLLKGRDGRSAFDIARRYSYDPRVAPLINLWMNPSSPLSDSSISIPPSAASSAISQKLDQSTRLSDVLDRLQTKIALEGSSKKLRYQSSSDYPNYSLPEDSHKYSVVIGIGTNPHWTPSEFSDRDARAVREHLLKLGYPSNHIQFLVNHSAEKSDWEAVLESWLPRNVRTDSEVLFYFSGFGVIEKGSSYLVPSNSIKGFLNETAFPLKRLLRDINRLKIRQVVCLLDSRFQESPVEGSLSQKLIPLRISQTVNLGSNVTVLLSSSLYTSVDERSGHGIFTHYFLKILNRSKGRISIRKLFQGIQTKMKERPGSQLDETLVLLGSGMGHL